MKAVLRIILGTSQVYGGNSLIDLVGANGCQRTVFGGNPDYCATDIGKQVFVPQYLKRGNRTVRMDYQPKSIATPRPRPTLAATTTSRASIR
jgi:hypothetical protein